MTLERTFQDFIQRHYTGEKPLLLGLSGGPDSLTLFYLLKKYDIPFGVAHVDHGWRSESGEEALQLKKLAKDHQIPYHEKKLVGVTSELHCREERIRFFKDLYNEYGYHALILGHQRDDQVETVFKRILEGASITNLSGMGEVSSMDGIPVWRPLISIEKIEILKWLQQQNLKAFFDATNEDPKYLRSRMRKQILPNLSETFGKEIHNSMFYLGEEAKELQFFLNKHLAPILSSVERSPSGFFLDLNYHPSLTPFELKYLIRALCKLGKLTASRDFVQIASRLVFEAAANKVLIAGLNHLYIDRKRLFLCMNPLKILHNEYKPLTDSMEFGHWKVTVTEANGPGCFTDWKGVWKGEIMVSIPKGNYVIGPSKAGELSKWWNNHKIPSFLVPTVPAIWQDGILVHEFLTGKTIRKEGEIKNWLEIKISS